MKHLLPLLLSFALLTSCSITKREYMPGYDVQWHNKKDPSTSLRVTKAEDKAEQSEKAQEQSPELASVNEAKPMMKKFAFPNLLLAGDTIITKNGDTILCKITKVGSVNIFYTEKNIEKIILKSNAEYYNSPKREGQEVLSEGVQRAYSEWALKKAVGGAVLCALGLPLILLIVGLVMQPIGLVLVIQSNKMIKQISSTDDEIQKNVKRANNLNAISLACFGIGYGLFLLSLAAGLALSSAR
jgi:hypothetical protein